MCNLKSLVLAEMSPAPLRALGFVSPISQPSWCCCNTVVSTSCGWQVLTTPERRQGFAYHRKKLDLFAVRSGEVVGKAMYRGDALTAAGVAKHAACYATKQAGPGTALKQLSI